MVFFRLLDTTESQKRVAASFGSRHTGADIVDGVHHEVGYNLVVKFVGELLLPDQTVNADPGCA